MRIDATIPYLFSSITDREPNQQADRMPAEIAIQEQVSLSQQLERLIRQRDLLRAQDKTLTQEIKSVRHILSQQKMDNRGVSANADVKADNKRLQYELALLARESGKTYSQLGKMLGVSRQRAHIIYQQAKKTEPAI